MKQNLEALPLIPVLIRKLRLHWRQAAIAAVLLLAGCGGLAYAAAVPAETELLYVGLEPQQKPLRLHVLANSDSPLDQQLKLEVRDQVIALLEERLATAADKEEAMSLVTAALPEIEQACCQYLASRVDYQAAAGLEVAAFPAINYNGLVFASGDYDALRVVLGAGEGRNWWCVLFPPLCFVDLAAEPDQEALAAAMAGSDQVVNGYRLDWRWLPGR